METAGTHKRVERLERRDVNGRAMVTCRDCGTTAHARNHAEAITNLHVHTTCAPDCENCKGLRESSTRRPAVPMGEDCNVVLHVCPNDGNRWWQMNGHFHLWQQVTSDEEWRILKQDALRNRSDLSEETGIGSGF